MNEVLNHNKFVTFIFRSHDVYRGEQKHNVIDLRSN